MFFKIIAATVPSYPCVSIVEAGYRAGYIGALLLENCNAEEARSAVDRLIRSGSHFAISVARLNEETRRLIEPTFGFGLTDVILSDAASPLLREDVATLKRRGVTPLVQVINLDQALYAQESGADGLIVKGNESGGRVGEETVFILLQRVVPRVAIPVFARGGIGLHTAAGALAAGASGVMLDWQLALCEESSLPEAVKSRIARMDGGETAILGQDSDRRYRAYARPTETGYTELKQLEERLAPHSGSPQDVLEAWTEAVEQQVTQRGLLLFGQDAAFAATLAERYRTVGGVCHAIHGAALRQSRVAARQGALDAGSPLAQSHGTRYPVVQGPMTRVSDRADFALAVADGGALPFLALALMRPAEVGALLEETQRKLGDKPWGIGILGFVPKELRELQLQEARKYSPPFAIIAGGRPDQAKSLEADGIRTYLHVPSPELLRNFLENGARRVVFEGRECGGHVGPRTSFVLWELAVRVILQHLESPGAGKAADYHVLFAGGIHDAVSAAAVSAIAAPLSERGVRIGVLLGTGYLFTHEAVAGGAIAEGFQEEAIRCERTILVESGVGHATRCAETSFGTHFADLKRRLLQEGRPKDDIREALERLNLGRLRIAAKGITREESPTDSGPVYKQVDDAEQRREGMYMIGQVAALRNSSCSIEDLHRQVCDASTILRSALAAMPTQSKSSDIAVIGLSCLLPKATNVAAYWRNILNKVNAIEEVPKERWDVDLYFDSDRNAPDRIYSRWGGFLDAIEFDPVRYGIPPNTVPAVEPLQLLTLELVRQALVDAGMTERPFDRERTSVVIGTGGGVGDVGLGYGFRSLLPHFLSLAGQTRADADRMVAELGDRLPQWTEDSFAGLLPNVAAGRVANRFDLGGANYVVDAACATSLAALRLAANEIETGASDIAIVAGADTMQSPFGYLCFSKTQALSPTGQCRTFDQSADGIVISEGIAVAVLKRLDNAIEDGDRIYSVLKSVGASSDGKDKGLTAPRPIGQIRALDRAYAKAGIHPGTVGLVEAHGTGTVVGDRTEMESLTTFLQGAGAAAQSCAIGSVKSMIGHTKCTAGFAGFHKAVLALHNKVLPPTTGVTKPNTKGKLSESPVYLNTEARPWFPQRENTPRRAGVSAFGFGGTNFHAVLEEYTAPEGTAPVEAPVEEWPAELFLWRAKSADDLLKAMGRVESALAQGAKPLLRDLAAGVYWHSGRETADHCLAIVAASLEDLAAKLEQAKGVVRGGKSVEDPRGVYYSPSASRVEGKIAFVFPGQGSQKVNMLGDLALAFPEVRKVFEEADSSLDGLLGKPLSAFVFPPPAFAEEDQKINEEALRQTRVAQPALGAAGIAMHRLLANLGIHPDMACGHSYGEFAALCAAGAMPFDDLIRISEARGRHIVESSREEPGTMAAVDAGEAAVSAAISGIKGVWLANLNAPLQTVISGTRAGVKDALARLGGKGIAGKPIPVACAFHSDLVAGAQEPLRKALDECTLLPPRVPVYSNTTAGPHDADPDQVRAVLTDHLLQPVHFSREILAMYEAGARIFIEAGPGKVLTGLVERILGDRPFKAIATDQPGRHGLLHLAHTLARLAVAGVPFFAWRLFEGRVTKSLNPEHLVAQTRVPQSSPTTWMINAWNAVPAHGPKLVAKRLPAAPAVVKENHNGTAKAIAPPPPVAPPPPISQPAATLPPPVSNGVPHGSLEAAMQGHHRLMSKFLETHRNIMLAYTSGVSAGVSAGNGHLAESAATGVYREVAPIVAAAPAQPVPVAKVAQVPVSQVPAVAEVQIAIPAPMAAKIAPEVAIRSAEEVIVERLIELVSQRTGYPPESLDLNLDLEADLGIDSIKRVEILSALQSVAALPPEALETEIETLSKLKTLRAIVEWIVQRTASPAAAPPVPAKLQSPQLPPAVNREEPAQEEPLCRMVVKVVDAPALVSAVPASQGLTLIIDDDKGIGELLAARLAELGTKCERLGGNEPAAIAETLKTLRAHYGAITRIIHLPALDGRQSLEPQLFKARLESDLMTLFHVVRECENDLRQRSGLVLAATRMGGAFAADGAVIDFWPGSGAICGFVKTIAREMPEVAARNVDFEIEAGGEQIVKSLLAEMGYRDGLLEVGYRAGRRITLTSVPTPLDSVRSNVNLNGDSVLLITGGARGITASVAIELANRFRCRLVLVGRSPLPAQSENPSLDGITDEKQLKAAIMRDLRDAGEKAVPAAVESTYRRIRRDREIRSNLRAMSHAGARMEYHAVDVCNETELGALIDDVYKRFGRIDGVIHGAGIIEDKFIRDKSPESFARVLNPKVSGALTLCTKLRMEELQFLAFFSSVSARYGNRGQGDYAAANEVLNKLAAWWNVRQGARVVSLDWGPWKSEGGMVTADLAERFVKAGVQLVSVGPGTRAFADEILFGKRTDAEVIWGGPLPHRQPANRADAMPGPLLSREGRVHRHTNGSLQIIMETSPEDDIYLLDHQLDGTPVMPMAMILELAAEIAGTNWPEMHLTGISDLRILKGITYPERAGRTLRVEAVQQPSRAREPVLVDVTLRTEASPAPHYRARLELRSTPPETPRSPRLTLLQPRPLPISVEQAYADWLFHGPLFAGILEVEALGDNGVIGWLRPSSATDFFRSGTAGSWTVDPSLIDSGLQLVLLWVRATLDLTPLPTYLGRYHRFGPVPQGRVRCEVAISGDPGNPTMRSDFWFFDNDGRPFARLEDMQFTSSRALNRLAKPQVMGAGSR